MLEIVNLQKTYGSGPAATEAIGDVSFRVDPGEFVCVVGPSGAGKTTLLKCMSGLLRPSAGHVSLDGRPVSGPPEKMALVFQDYSRSLLPWMSVRRNIVMPLKRKKLSRAERDARTEHAIASVGLTGFGDQIATKALPRFAELRAHVYTQIKRTTAPAERSPADADQPALAAAGPA
jgi:NitT/TauT family transport system ATP-binding protein